MKDLGIVALNEAYSDFSFYEYVQKNITNEDQEFVKEIIVQKNEYIYEASMKHNYMYEVVEGSVKLGSYLDTGDEFIYDILCKRDFFGNLQYLNGQFNEFAKTLIDSRIRVYKLSFFKKVIIHKPKIAEWYISYLVKRWCSTEKKLKKIHEKGMIEKIKFLQSNFNINVRDVQNKKYVVYELLTQKDLGDLIGTTRQTIANALKQM